MARGRLSGPASAVPVLALVFLSFAGCQNEAPPRPSKSDDAEVSGRQSPGPLSVGGGKGGVAVDPPPGSYPNYVATFGGFVLCSQTSAVPHLSEVVFESNAPVATKAVVRRVTPALVRGSPRAERTAYAPLAFTLGSPPHYREPYAGLPAPGDYRGGLADVEVQQSCQEAESAVVAVNDREVPIAGYLELMVVVPASAEGAIVDGFTIHYDVEGDSHSLRVPWTMVVCDQKRTRQQCQGR